MKKPYIIAEIGVNYYDISTKYNIPLIEAAILMVNKAQESGANAVKFQSYKAEKIASKHSPSYWDLKEESTTNQYDLFKKYDKFGEEEYNYISLHCKKIGIDFMSTPFDLESIDYLNKIVNIHKISSSDITNYSLLKKVAKTNKKIIISTGASNMDEIENAISIIKSEGNNDIVLMHCVLNYPTLNENANLGMINDLKRFNYEVGYSDHTLPDENMQILSTAFNLGAIWIEKHFTLDKTLKGNDHYHAMDPIDLKKFINNIEFINQIMGSNKKYCLESENISRLNARRSIVTSRNLIKGTILKKEDLICKRPATGICASKIEELIGKEINTNLEEDTTLKWEMII